MYCLIWKIVKWFFVKSNREIIKVSPEEELVGFLLADSEASIKLIKGLLTAQTVRYFEETTQEGRLMRKGAASILKTIKDCHEEIKTIQQKYPDNIKMQLEVWQKHKRNNITT